MLEKIVLSIIIFLNEIYGDLLPIENLGSGVLGLISPSKSLTLSSIWNPWIDAETYKWKIQKILKIIQFTLLLLHSRRPVTGSIGIAKYL